MKRGLLYKYLIPDDVDYVMLRPLNIYGWMESGKTTLSLKIAARIEEEVGDKQGFLCVLGRRQTDVLLYLDENRDVVRGNSYVVIIYDDAGRHYMSRGESVKRERREELKDYLELRHVFEGFGMERGVIIPIFNIQYYSLLDKTLRNAPAGIWKSVVMMDRSERREFILNVGWKYYYFLKVITRAMFLDKYVFTRGEIPYPRGTRGEQIYTWLRDFFVSKGALEVEGGGVLLKRDFAKRFGLLVLLGDRAVVDFGTEVKKPKNLIEVQPRNSEEWWMPINQEEKRRILWWTAYIGVRTETTAERVMALLREAGLTFGDHVFGEIWGQLSLMYSNGKRKGKKRGTKTPAQAPVSG